MPDTLLTNDAEYLLCELYAAYRERIKNGTSKMDAKLFGGYTSIQESYFPGWLPDDVDETLRELARAGFIHSSYGDNHTYCFYLEDQAIIYMETRFKRGLAEVLEHAKALRSLIF